MIIPGITYQYAQPKDVAGGTLIIVNKKLEASETVQGVIASLLVVPADKVFVLSAATVTGFPNSGAKCEQLHMYIRFEETAHDFARNYATFEANNDEAVIRDLNWSGELWVPPNSDIVARGFFSDATAPNALSFRVHGVLIPRGNVQQG